MIIPLLIVSHPCKIRLVIFDPIATNSAVRSLEIKPVLESNEYREAMLNWISHPGPVSPALPFTKVRGALCQAFLPPLCAVGHALDLWHISHSTTMQRASDLDLALGR